MGRVGNRFAGRGLGTGKGRGQANASSKARGLFKGQVKPGRSTGDRGVGNKTSVGQK